MVTICTTRFVIKKFYIFYKNYVCFVFISHNKQSLYSTTSLTIGIYNRAKICLLGGKGSIFKYNVLGANKFTKWDVSWVDGDNAAFTTIHQSTQ
jgi:hypothetical protein